MPARPRDTWHTARARDTLWDGFRFGGVRVTMGIRDGLIAMGTLKVGTLTDSARRAKKSIFAAGGGGARGGGESMPIQTPQHLRSICLHRGPTPQPPFGEEGC